MKKFLLSFVALFCAVSTFAVERITIKEFLEKADTQTVYELEGTITKITNDYYGNFYMEQDDASIFIYGLVKGEEKYNLVTSLGLKAGDKIVVQGAYTEYATNPEIINAEYISHVSGETPDSGEDPVVTGDNLLANGDFEAWDGETPVNWKSACTASNATLAKSTEAHAGKYAVTVKGNSSSNKRLAYKELTLKAGSYVFTFFAKATSENVAQVRPGYAPVNDGTVGNYSYGDYVSISTDWKEYKHEFTLDAETTLCLVVMNPKAGSYSSGEDVLIDDAALKTSNGGIVAGGGDDPEPPVTPEAKKVTIAEAIAIAMGLVEGTTAEGEYIVEGEISYVKEISTVYGNATFDITDGENNLTIFRCKDFNNEKFTDENRLKVGDVVKVQGKLQNYNGVAELSYGYLLDINGTGVESIVANEKAGVRYNIAGQKVADDYRGIVIMNGKKFINK